jgi:hypothetical protein
MMMKITFISDYIHDKNGLTMPANTMFGRMDNITMLFHWPTTKPNFSRVSKMVAVKNVSKHTA